MKHSTLLTTVLALLLLASFSVYANDAKPEAEKEAPKELKNQTHCPVMGGKLDSTVFTDIQGQRVYHCCPGCSKPLKEDPDKYFKKAAAEGVLFENIQTACPVSGEKLEEKTAYLDFEGRRVYFCCEGCFGAFKDDPKGHLAKLDTPADETEKSEKKMEGHEGHGH
jgi:YHS domain-containing protein